jgi:tetratricopeptide (TPR) repeat protein
MFYSFLGGLGLFFAFFIIKKVNKKLGVAILITYAIVAVLLLAGIVEKDLFINKIYNIHNVFKYAGGSARLVIWQDVMPQVWQKPLFGWGPENFELAFYPIFDPKLFLQEYGGEVWFDRAHNVFIDNLISTGIIGLLAYLALAGAAIWFLYKESKKANGDYWALATMAPLMAAYYIQNATVFDMVSSLLVFYLSLAFIVSLGSNDEGAKNIFANIEINKNFGVLFVAVLFGLFSYTFVVRGFDANVGVIDIIFSYNAFDNMPTYCKLKNSKNLSAQMTPDQKNFLVSFAPTAERLELVYGACDGKDYQYRNKYDFPSFQRRQKYFTERVEAGRYGLYQNRDFLADIYITNISQFDRLAVEQALKDKDVALMNSILQGIKGDCDMWVSQLQDSTKTSPVDFRAFLKLGYVSGFCGRNLREASYIGIAEAALNKAKELSPKNPHTYWYMSQVLMFKGDKDGAGRWLQEALKLRDDLPQTYAYLVQFYNVIGDQKTALVFANQALAKYAENEKKNPAYAQEWVNSANQMKQIVSQMQAPNAAPVKK